MHMWDKLQYTQGPIHFPNISPNFTAEAAKVAVNTFVASCLHYVSALLYGLFNYQLEITFSASTRCLCVFILPVGRHAMLLQYANMYTGTGHSNSKYNMKYNLFWPWQFARNTLQICKRKPWHYHTTINYYHWFTDATFCMQCIGIFQRWQTKVDLSIPECSMWYWWWHLVDA